MKRLKQLSLFCLIFAHFSSCAHVEEEYIDAGPIVTGCSIDVQRGGFDCMQTEGQPFFVTFAQAGDLICNAPSDLEVALKACKKGSYLPGPTCTVSKGVVSCSDAIGKQYSLELKTMDNYFCLSAADRKRVFDRCTPSKV